MIIVYIVEKGLLEQQAVLLQKSINRFHRSASDVTAVACCVREAYQPSVSTIKSIENLGGKYVYQNLNTRHDYFPLCNGIYAASEIETQTSEDILLVDTDTVFVNPLDARWLHKYPVVVRPVDNKGIGSAGDEDPADGYWQQSFGLFGLPAPVANMTTTVDQQLIRPYYNSGFVFARHELGFFTQWKKTFERLMDSEVRTDSGSSRHQVNYGFNEQMSISIVLQQLKTEPLIPPITINYPLPFRPRFKKQGASDPAASDLIHVHYHRWFQHPDFIGHVFDQEEQKLPSISWLASELPFYPTISGPQKC
ncbi:hypothetical protein ACFODZ_12380 [Marinicella sediminis]|uniref:Nucleotide-diphospho-sugar transferase n=1 Tax=Marinicella sediminis TaxID=1792834 RepID=A0ABV7JDU0_9GAMM|nr:hypothetical protein [Marinicella sediminis]